MAESIKTHRANTKVAAAVALFKELSGVSRAVVVQKFQKDLGLTEKGASTYYQNVRKELGLTRSRKAASPQ